MWTVKQKWINDPYRWRHVVGSEHDGGLVCDGCDRFGNPALLCFLALEMATGLEPLDVCVFLSDRPVQVGVPTPNGKESRYIRKPPDTCRCILLC